MLSIKNYLEGVHEYDNTKHKPKKLLWQGKSYWNIRRWIQLCDWLLLSYGWRKEKIENVENKRNYIIDLIRKDISTVQKKER